MAAAVGAQVFWGIFPAYIKLFQGVIAPLDLVAHRALWSFLVLAIWLAIASRLARSRNSASDVPAQPSLQQRLFGQSKTIRISVFAAVAIVVNWLMFVWAVSNDHAIDASLGYYICPQIVVLLGVVFLRERLTPLQWIAVLLATVGVTIMTWSANSNIWIGLVVAVAFALYSLIKKKTQLSAAEGLTMETGLMFLPVIAWFAWRTFSVGVSVIPQSATLSILLACSGFVTIAPLFLYAIAVKHLSLSTVGLLQFIGPTIQFFLGLFAFGEPVDSTRLFGFVFVWIGVSVYLYALHRRSRLAIKAV
ncbi:EamA family transporter RarD [Mariniblastus fucicola]|uniref:EamA-like transporter family protein n=1 Tax=Mariniblastus fucicola TaxID=980251 RepID=A0A5B9PEJ8_9BACT|nr:EamA family transporter RarD [Mariniblastus fucicola]QEG25137.1 EamA-like transporter family protein [Mariniblastus fucicola]